MQSNGRLQAFHSVFHVKRLPVPATSLSVQKRTGSDQEQLWFATLVLGYQNWGFSHLLGDFRS